MRANPLICLEVDEISGYCVWTSVVVFGRYEELGEEGEAASARDKAQELLAKRAMWWQPAYVAITPGEDSKALIPTFYRIHIDRVSGHQARPDPEAD